jgi:phosphate transport system protein
LRDQEVLWDEFLVMGRAAVDSLEKSVAVLCDSQLDVVGEIKRLEQDSESAEARIEQECLRVLALFEPVASDLRRLATVLKVSRGWERIAELAARIARRARKLAGSASRVPVPEALKTMARDVLAQARAGYEALATRDVRRARAVIDGDGAIDRQYRRLRGDLKESLREQAGELDAWLELLSTARHLERIADMVADIAEMTVYLQEGVIVRDEARIPMPRD